MYMYNDRYEWREEGGGFGVLELSWAARRIVCGVGVEDGGWRLEGKGVGGCGVEGGGFGVYMGSAAHHVSQ